MKLMKMALTLFSNWLISSIINPMNKCPCDEHNCLNQDDYTQDEYMCEECFMDCVEMEEV